MVQKNQQTEMVLGGSLEDFYTLDIDLDANLLGVEAPDEFAKNELGESGILQDGNKNLDFDLSNLLGLTRRWRPCNSIIKLREQINQLAPDRDVASDGTIGDRRHRTRKSDHNPWIIDSGVGVVTALDITHDPDGGCDCQHFVELLRQNQDSRIKYLIWNHRIFNSKTINGVSPWTWRNYGGANPHTNHFHLSVGVSKAEYDNVTEWQL